MKADKKTVIEAGMEQIKKSDFKPSLAWVLEEDAKKIEEGLLKNLNNQVDKQIETLLSAEPTKELKGIYNLSEAFEK